MSLNTPARFTYVPSALTCSRLHNNSLDIPEYLDYFKTYRETFSILSIINLENNNYMHFTYILYQYVSNITNKNNYTLTQDLCCDIFQTKQMGLCLFYAEHKPTQMIWRDKLDDEEILCKENSWDDKRYKKEEL